MKERSISYPALVSRITLCYFLSLAGLIILTIQSGYPLYLEEETQNPIYTTWLKLLLFFYYGAPFIIAFSFGILFRPFLQNFRNLYITILTIQGLYSFFMYITRDQYSEKRQSGIQQARLSRWRILSFEHQPMDFQNDGKVDQIDFLTRLEFFDFPEGEYQVFLILRQKTKENPRIRIGNFRFIVPQKEERIHNIRFQVYTDKVLGVLPLKDFEVDLGVEEILGIDEVGKRILSLARWAPYFRSGDWQGRDRHIKEEIVELDLIPKVYSFSIN